LPPYMLIIEPTNIEKKNLFALVGKGVTFDAG
jgi:leucyl aminopeptidase